MFKMENIFVSAIVLLLLKSTNCACPTCTISGTKCNGTVCKFPNSNAYACSSLESCYDTVYGLCDTKCTCITGYIWSTIENMCIPFPNGTIPCTTHSNCSYSGVCKFGKCMCDFGYRFYQLRCFTGYSIPNNGVTTLSGDLQCYDTVNGYASGSRCFCNSTYTYSPFRFRCGLPNTGSACSSDNDCIDKYYGGCINSKCECIPPAVWSALTLSCGLPGNSTFFCTSYYDCADYADCVGGRCVCASPNDEIYKISGSLGYFGWSSCQNKCVLLVDNGGISSSCLDECKDRVNGRFASSKCSCNTGYSWDASLMCRKTIIGSSCSTNSNCEQSSIKAVCSSGTCSCDVGATFYNEKCCKKMNGLSNCTASSECCTSNEGGCVDGKCRCIQAQLSDTSCAIVNLKKNDGVSTCTRSAECKTNDDSGGCIGGFCGCYIGKLITDQYGSYCRSFTRNEYSIPCNSSAECVDHVNGLCSSSKTCTCPPNFLYYSVILRCLAIINGPCKKDTDCNFFLGLMCVSNKCVCKPGYVQYATWCNPPYDNDIGFPLDSGIVCRDSVNGGIIASYNLDKYCGCYYGNFYSKTLQKCVIRNDGIFPCNDSNQCADSVKGGCQGTCICNTGLTWSSKASKCGKPNDGTSSCTDKNDCLDVVSGACVNSKCVCIRGIWDYNALICTTANLFSPDKSHICSTNETCIDSFNGYCNGKCKCKLNLIYSKLSQKCGKPNDNSSTCTFAYECADINNGDCYNNFCICKYPTLWHPDGDCKFPNDEISGGSGELCYVYTGYYYTLRSCLCNKFYRWNPNIRNCVRIKENDEVSTCTDDSECADSVNGGCISGYCKCKDGLIYSLQIQACKNQNNNTGACSTSMDCVDSINGTCSSNKCICINNSIWIKAKFMCTSCDDGTYAVPAEFACYPCSPLCTRCTLTAKNCQACNTSIANINQIQGSVCACKDGYYEVVNNKSSTCQLCGRTCGTCVRTADTCITCKKIDNIVLFNESCTCPQKYFLFNNTAKGVDECLPCHPLCSKCDGNLTTQCDDCDRNLGAIFISPRTCACRSMNYYDEQQKFCMGCHSFCLECFGSGFNKCYGCNMSLSFNVIDQPNLCVEDCFQLDGYYSVSRTCQLCHKDCKQCTGPSDSECIECRNVSKVMFQGRCLNECPKHYYPNQRICYECHQTCENCTNGTRFSCTSCESSLRLWNQQCVYPCPVGTYEDRIKCLNCISPCQTCISSTECITCLDSFYKINNTYRCVGENDCPLGTFPDSISKYCLNCFHTCLTCKGVENRDCMMCNFTAGYGGSFGQVGECYSLVCYDGMFLEINKVENIARCSYCHPSCRTCDSSDRDNCIQCKPDLAVANSLVPNRVRCLSCSDINKGYKSTPQGCTEICGDGINLGQVECDDGNTMNGDGCSSGCKTEEGFRCTKRAGEPDLCIDIKPPEAFLRVKRGNILEIVFSESVLSLLNSDELLENLIITLENAKSGCELSYSLKTHFVAGSVFDKISIQAKVACSLRGSSELFTIKFSNTSLIKDCTGNLLKTIYISAQANKFTYISDAQKAAVEGSGASFSITTLVVFCVTLAINSLQSVAIGAFWDFVNMLQIISYISVISCEVPSNLNIFLTKYLTVSKVSIPFKLLPDGFFNPIKLFSYFLLDSVAERFLEGGYDSYSFIYNLADEISTWLLLLLAYFVIRVLIKFVPESKCSFLRKWKKDYEYNALIRIFIEGFISLIFCATLNIWMLDYNSLKKKISLGAACIGGYLSLAFFVISFWIVETPNEVIEQDEFKDSYGTIFEGIDINRHFMCKFYYPIYLFRRLLFGISLVVLSFNTILQLCLIIIIIIAPMLVYLIIYQPFIEKRSNMLAIYNESITGLLFFLMLIMNVSQMPTYIIDTIGWVLIVLIIGSFASSCYLMIPELLKGFKELVSQLCKKAPVTESTQVVEITKSEVEQVQHNVNSGVNVEPKKEEKLASPKETEVIKACDKVTENALKNEKEESPQKEQVKDQPTLPIFPDALREIKKPITIKKQSKMKEDNDPFSSLY